MLHAIGINFAVLAVVAGVAYQFTEYRNEAVSASISMVLSGVITYGFHLVYSSQDITWAVIAVLYAGFFSGAGTAYSFRTEKE